MFCIVITEEVSDCIEYGSWLNVQDLDLTKPGVWVPTEKQEFQVTTKDVLEKADFRVCTRFFFFLQQRTQLVSS